MKIVVDAYGSDRGPSEVVKGVVDALAKKQDLEVILTGDEKELNALIGDKKERITVIDAPEVITNDDVPTSAIKKKTQSSLVKALEVLASDDGVSGLVSAGSTGAVLTGAFMKIGRIKGVSRPALSPLLPSVDGKGVCICDCGANVDCKPINLIHFAYMGAAFAGAMFGIDNPRVALLNNGAEAHKGNELTKTVYEALTKQDLNFVGNIEGRDIISGKADVVVADGFDGNIALKSLEGTALAIFDLLKQGISEAGFKEKIGAALFKPVLYGLKNKMDYNQYGGACFLGIKKVIIKAHGSSKYTSISASVLQAARLAEAGVVQKIEEAVAKIKSEEADA